MSRRNAGQERFSGLNVTRRKGRVRAAVGREIAAARARGVDVSPASVTVAYVLADVIDSIDETGEDRYLLPQLAARLLDERRAASTLPERPAEAGDDVWTALAKELAGHDTAAPVGDAPQP